MDVPLYRITVEPITVTLPDICPGCGDPIDDAHRIDGFELSDRALYVGRLDGNGVLTWDDGENQYDRAYVYSLACGGCGAVLINELHDQTPGPPVWPPTNTETEA